MKRKIICLVIIGFFLASGISTTGITINGNDDEWYKAYGWEDYESGTDVKQTSDGGYIIVGSSDSAQISSGKTDLLLLKTDNSGNEIWHKTFGGEENDFGRKVLIVDDGYIILGFTNSSGNGGYDFWLIRTDSNGNKIWDKTYGSKHDERGLSIEQTNDGYICVGYIIYPSHDTDVSVLKVNSNGDEQWSRTYGSWDYDSGNCIIRLKQDNSYVIAGTSLDKVFLLKIDENGDEIWSKTYDEGCGKSVIRYPSNGDFILSAFDGNKLRLIRTDPEGNLEWSKEITSGSFYSGDLKINSAAEFVVVGAKGTSDSDVVLVKTDKNGENVKIRAIGGTDSEYGYGLDLTDDGGYVVTGSIFTKQDYDHDVLLMKIASMEDMDPETIISEGPEGEIDYHDFTVSWTSEDDHTPEKNIVYSYKLVGQDEDWSKWTNKNSKSYRGLENNDYTFMVKSKDRSGNIDETPAEQSFTVNHVNSPPDTPTIQAATNGKTNKEYEFIISSVDVDDDKLKYFIDSNGDGEFVRYPRETYKSGEEVKFTLSWGEAGNYTMQFKAKDEHGLESNIATHQINISKSSSKSKQYTYPILQRLLERFTRIMSKFQGLQKSSYFSRLKTLDTGNDEEFIIIKNNEDFKKYASNPDAEPGDIYIIENYQNLKTIDINGTDAPFQLSNCKMPHYLGPAPFYTSIEISDVKNGEINRCDFKVDIERIKIKNVENFVIKSSKITGKLSYEGQNIQLINSELINLVSISGDNIVIDGCNFKLRYIDISGPFLSNLWVDGRDAEIKKCVFQGPGIILGTVDGLALAGNRFNVHHCVFYDFGGSGLNLAGIKNSEIHHNNIFNNWIGIWAWLENKHVNNTIHHNNIYNIERLDFWGGWEPENGATITWNDETGGNYWGNYTGLDNNGDGIGDTPYELNIKNIDYKPYIEKIDIPGIPTSDSDDTVNRVKTRFPILYQFLERFQLLQRVLNL